MTLNCVSNAAHLTPGIWFQSCAAMMWPAYKQAATDLRVHKRFMKYFKHSKNRWHHILGLHTADFWCFKYILLSNLLLSLHSNHWLEGCPCLSLGPAGSLFPLEGSSSSPPSPRAVGRGSCKCWALLCDNQVFYTILHNCCELEFINKVRWKVRFFLVQLRST